MFKSYATLPPLYAIDIYQMVTHLILHVHIIPDIMSDECIELYKFTSVWNYIGIQQWGVIHAVVSIFKLLDKDILFWIIQATKDKTDMYIHMHGHLNNQMCHRTSGNYR